MCYEERAPTKAERERGVAWYSGEALLALGSVAESLSKHRHSNQVEGSVCSTYVFAAAAHAATEMYGISHTCQCQFVVL